MAKPKTVPTDQSVAAYIGAIGADARRAECRQLAKIMRKVTGEAPRIWGANIVGFGVYRYKYASGREGESLIVGFSSRASGISVYLSSAGPRQKLLLAGLGKHKMAKACLSIRQLTDVDVAVLEELVADSFAETKRRQG